MAYAPWCKRQRFGGVEQFEVQRFQQGERAKQGEAVPGFEFLQGQVLRFAASGVVVGQHAQLFAFLEFPERPGKRSVWGKREMGDAEQIGAAFQGEHVVDLMADGPANAVFGESVRWVTPS